MTEEKEKTNIETQDHDPMEYVQYLWTGFKWFFGVIWIMIAILFFIAWIATKFS